MVQRLIFCVGLFWSPCDALKETFCLFCRNSTTTNDQLTGPDWRLDRFLERISRVDLIIRLYNHTHLVLGFHASCKRGT